MKTSLLKTIRQSGNESRRSRINYKIITFLVCIAISVLLWFMNMLSKKYTEDIAFHVEYLHVPQNKNLSPSAQSVNIKVVTTGYNISAYKLGFKDAILNIDAGQFRKRSDYYLYSLENKSHLEKIEDQLGEEIKVMDITPDTLYLQPPQEQN